MQIKAFDYWKSKPQDYKDPWYAHFIPGFKQLSSQDIPQGAGFGLEYDTRTRSFAHFLVSMHTIVYTSWLLSQFISKGGKALESSLSHIDDAFKLVPNTFLVVNCTGLGIIFVNSLCRCTLTRRCARYQSVSNPRSTRHRQCASYQTYGHPSGRFHLHDSTYRWNCCVGWDF